MVATSIARKLIKGRTAAGKRADKKASTSRAKAAKERRERKLNTKKYRNVRNVPVKKDTFKKAEAPYKPTLKQARSNAKKYLKDLPRGAFKTKSGARDALKKFGVPGKIIAGVLAVAGGVGISKKLNKKDKKPAAKKETPMKRRFRAGPTAGSGLGNQRRSGTLRGKNVVANPPKRKNKIDTGTRPRRPGRPSMTGFRK